MELTSTRSSDGSSLSRRDQLEQQLVRLFLLEGFTNLTMDTIAARLSCSKSTLYAIAPNKDSLVRKVLGVYFREAAARAEQEIAHAPDPREAIRLYLRQIAVDLRPASAAFMRELTGNPIAISAYEFNTRIASNRIRDLLNLAHERGLLQATNTEFVGEIVQTAITKIHRGDFRRYGISDADAFDHLADLVVR